MFNGKDFLPIFVNAMQPREDNEHSQYKLDDMFDIEKLVSIVADVLEAEMEYQKYIRKLKEKKRISPDSCVWIPSLNGSESYDLGVLFERSERSGWILSDICAMLGIDQKLLIAVVKSMQRKERHNGRWDNPCLTYSMRRNDKERLYKFLKAGGTNTFCIEG